MVKSNHRRESYSVRYDEGVWGIQKDGCWIYGTQRLPYNRPYLYKINQRRNKIIIKRRLHAYLKSGYRICICSELRMNFDTGYTHIIIRDQYMLNARKYILGIVVRSEILLRTVEYFEMAFEQQYKIVHKSTSLRLFAFHLIRSRIMIFMRHFLNINCYELCTFRLLNYSIAFTGFRQVMLLCLVYCYVFTRLAGMGVSDFISLTVRV